jgi:nucleoside 2-deoxyribosyltransferase
VKVYLSATMSRAEDMADKAEQLELHGVQVTSTWHMKNAQALPALQAAEQDLSEILAADAVIFFSEPALMLGKQWGADANIELGAFSAGRGGRHFELGYAVGHGKRCYIVGERENVFLHLPTLQRYATWGHCRDSIIVAARVRHVAFADA